MGKDTSQQNAAQRDSVIQDRVSCPREAPWAPRVSKVTSLLFIPIIALAIYVLAQTSLLKLALWLLIFVLFAYPLRYLVCARCPYYGQTCSTNLGRMVPLLFKKQEGKSMKFGLWLDVVCITVLLLIPLPDVWRTGGILMLLLWCGVFFLMAAVLTRLACSVCPLTFCPIGQAGRAIWKRPAV